MKILGIESSCDETGVAIVEDGATIISNVVASSEELHAKTGGVIPEVAAREQIKCIIPVLDEASVDSFDAVAVTVGPGLIGSLLIGIETAKVVSFALNKPLVPVNHLIGHIYANWLIKTPNLPAIALVVSGGHTDLVLMHNHKLIEYLGGTRDDAAGECFDKTARLLGFSYPGGPAIAREAQFGNPKAYNLPRPMIDSGDYDFSFSGLKTAVFNITQKLSRDELEFRRTDLAASIEEAIVDVLVSKTLKAAKEMGVKTILLGGGVAANKRLREKFTKSEFSIYFPPPFLCADNAAKIAAAAYFQFQSVPWQEIKANPSLSVIPGVS